MKNYKQFKQELQENTLEDVTDFFKDAFGVKRGPTKQETLEHLQNITLSKEDYLDLEDHKVVTVEPEDARLIYKFLQLLEFDPRLVSQLTKSKQDFNVVFTLATGKRHG